MYNDDIGRRKIAISITHYAYRNTRLEDFYAECVKMDKAFYRKIYSTVRDKLKNVCLFQRYIDDFPYAKIEEIDNKSVFDELIRSVPEDLQLKFIRYLQDITFGLMLGSKWEPANKVEEISEGQSLATYVLAGRFLECCKNDCILNDTTMYQLNKDVHNRIYTLLLEGKFNNL